jgi:hypothetical protein
MRPDKHATEWVTPEEREAIATEIEGAVQRNGYPSPSPETVTTIIHQAGRITAAHRGTVHKTSVRRAAMQIAYAFYPPPTVAETAVKAEALAQRLATDRAPTYVPVARHSKYRPEPPKRGRSR